MEVMGFKTVFSALQDVFPQVDLRILKAVAIEHSTDVDAAVEFILFEVLPSLSEPETVNYNLHDTHGMEQPSSDAGPNKQVSSWGVEGVGESISNMLPGPSSLAPECDMFDDHTNDDHVISRQAREEVGEGPYIGFGGEMLPEVGENSVVTSEPENVEKATPLFEHIGNYFEANANHLTEAVPMGSSSNVSGVNYIDQLVTGRKHEEVSLSDYISQLCKSALENVSETESYDAETAGQEDNGTILAAHTRSQDASLLAEGELASQEHGAVDLDIRTIFAAHTHSQDASLLVEGELASQEHGAVDLDIGTILAAHTRSQDGSLLVEGELASQEHGAVDLDIARSLNEHLSNSAVVADIQDSDGLEANRAASESFGPAQDFSSSLPDKFMESMECRTVVLENFNELIGTKKNLCSSEGSVEGSFDSESLAGNNESASRAARSSQFVSIEFMESLVAGAKDTKKLLVSEMESVRDLMKEVQLHEDAAKLAKEEASAAGQDIHTKVEEFREILTHAREANSMHAGEVYGEKSILATEARELQSRLVTLSEKRDGCLNIIEEMRQTLEGRLGAAKEEIAAAEQEKLEREALEQNALHEQEIIMESIVQESKRLQQEAEENSKLREFLMDRGRAVDILQGEIAVICEDSMMLKERVDGHLQLIRSQTSRPGSLATSLSTSSHRSVSSDGGHPVDVAENTGIVITRSQSSRSSSLAASLSSSSRRSASSDRVHPVDVTENTGIVIQDEPKSQRMENASNYDKEIHGNKDIGLSDDWELCDEDLLS